MYTFYRILGLICRVPVFIVLNVVLLGFTLWEAYVEQNLIKYVWDFVVDITTVELTTPDVPGEES